jgi:hypothetical protein
MKDPATTDVTRGWCRVMGLAAIALLLACAIQVRNDRVIESFEERQRVDAQRREALSAQLGSSRLKAQQITRNRGPLLENTQV